MILRNTQHGCPSHPRHQMQPPTTQCQQQITKNLGQGIKRENVEKNKRARGQKLEQINQIMGGGLRPPDPHTSTTTNGQKPHVHSLITQQAPCQLCVTTRLQATECITRDRPRSFTLAMKNACYSFPLPSTRPLIFFLALHVFFFKRSALCVDPLRLF